MSKFDQTTVLGGETITLTDETRFVGEIAVRRYRIITTNIWVYNALEPLTTHSTITSIEHAAGKRTSRTAAGEYRYDWFGAIGTQNPPAEIDALPRGETRYTAVKAWRAKEHLRAQAAILEAFPEARFGTPDGGEIELFVKVAA